MEMNKMLRENMYCALPTEKLNGSQYFWEECFEYFGYFRVND